MIDFILIIKFSKMLLEIIMICSLTYSSPFYDCSERWEIRIYDEPVLCNNADTYIEAAGCTNFLTKKIAIYDYAMREYGKDEYGLTPLEHELEHLKCMCDFHSQI
jgi:hypothetical protein